MYCAVLAGKGNKQALTNNDEIALALKKNKDLINQ